MPLLTSQPTPTNPIFPLDQEGLVNVAGLGFTVVLNHIEPTLNEFDRYQTTFCLTEVNNFESFQVFSDSLEEHTRVMLVSSHDKLSETFDFLVGSMPIHTRTGVRNVLAANTNVVVRWRGNMLERFVLTGEQKSLVRWGQWDLLDL